MSNEKQKAIFGIGWTTVSTAFTMLAQILRVVILTRFLGKSDFGIVAMVNVVIGFCTTFGDLGFASVIMYRQKLEKEEFSSLYWVQFLVFSFLYLAIVLLSDIISSSYGEPLLGKLIPISALSILFLAIGKLYDSVLQKRYEFKTLAVRSIISNALSLVLAVYLACAGYGFYSLIISTLFQLLFYNIWNLVAGYKMQPVCFHLNLSSEIIRLLKMGLYQTLTRVLDFVSTKVDILLIGSYLGTDALGVYDLAKELVQKLVNLVKTIVSSVALPFLSNSNTDDKLVISRYYIITKVVAYVCFPICIITAVFSKPIVEIMYGKSFIDAYPLVAIFSIMTMINSIASFFDMLGISKGRTDLNLYNTLIRVFFTIPVIWICCQFSLNIVALGHLLLALALFFVIWVMIARKTYNLSIVEYYHQFNQLLFVFIPYSVMFYVVRYILFGYYIEETLETNLNMFVVYILVFLPKAYYGLNSDLNSLLKRIRQK